MKRIPIGLALSGGTAKSVAHAGVIRALEENGIGIDYLSGTSGGSIVAVLYASGKTSSELIKIAEGMHWRKLAGLTLPRLGFLSSDKIRDFIVGEIGDIDFSDLKIPTAVVAADLTSGKKVVFREGKVAVACQASSSIPEVYSPVEIEGHSIVDGGLVEYLPVETLSGFGDIFKIGVNLGMRDRMRKAPRHIFEVIMQVTGFVSHRNAEVSERKADFIVRPDLDAFSPFALNKASDMIEEGYSATIECIPSLKEAVKSYESLGGRLKRKLLGSRFST